MSEKTLERWRHTGTGPGFVKIVGRILYPIAGIEATEAKGTHFAHSSSAGRAAIEDGGVAKEGLA